MRPYLADIIAAYTPPEEEDMADPTDIQKLTQRIQRANILTARAANSGSHGDAVMNSFEQTLNKYDDHFSKIKEYDAQLAAMMNVMGNGGPPLEATFQSTAATAAPKPAVASATHASTALHIDHATGDPLKA